MPSQRSPITRLAATAAALVVGFASMGASCSPRIGSPFGVAGPPAPAVLTPTSSTAEVIAAVNANSSRVQTYQTQQASVALPQSAGLPLVSASIAVERPQRFRMRATTAITGPEIDLGSNDERFWIWARRNEPPALYTARHDQWATSPMRGQIPIEPAWLIDALGLVQLDPNAPYVGPLPRQDGAVELRTQVANGGQQRVYIIDGQTAWVREQHVYDTAGSLVASVFADRFQYDPATQVSLPERVRINVPASGLDLTINTGSVVINAPVGDGSQLWSLPQMGNYPVVDLTAPGGGAPSGAWDLAGSGTAYGRTEPIATPFAPAATQPLVTLEATPTYNPAARVDPSPQPSTYLPQGAPPVTASVQPVALPQSSGFTGLPAGGRILP